jgi:hypothetical protein
MVPPGLEHADHVFVVVGQTIWDLDCIIEK